MSVRDRLSVTAALAVLLAATAIVPVLNGQGWVLRTLGAVLVVLAASVGARRLAVPLGLQPLATLLALLVYLVVAFVPDTLLTGTPGVASYDALRALLREGGDDLAQYAAPAPATTALVLLVAGGIGLVAVAVDALASVVGRPAAAGLPLLALFAVPSAVLDDGLGWLPFVLGAAGWLALLLVEGRHEAVRWAAPGQRTGADSGAAGLNRVGRRIGGAALGIAVVVPALVPGLQGRLFDGSGVGSGEGGGASRSITTYNPITRLRGQLTLPDPVRVLHYRTDDPEPDYLRMTTLGVYDGSGWRQAVLRGNLREDGVDDPLPSPPGRSATVRTRTVQDEITIDTLDAFWLPAPATPSVVEVRGPWMWDRGSESVFATRSNTGKVKSYTVQASRVLPDPAALTTDGVVPAEVEPYATAIPATDLVRNLTNRVVRGQTSDYGRANALQSFFRNPANDFTYSADTVTGASPDALEDFLRSRQGFCEQYASAMAAMLRIAGVPSRVAVGFTPGKKQADGSYVVTTSEAHAWPEAWFEGAGWVRFEPTPSQGGIRPPQYAGPQAPAGAAGAAAPTDPGAATDEEDESALTREERQERLLADREARTSAGPQAAPASDPSAADRVPVRELVAVGVLLVLLVLPALLHVLRRRRRWREPTPSTAWTQLRDDVTDSGHRWLPADSPRAAASRLVGEVGLSGDAAAALTRLAGAVERERYARPGGDATASAGSLAADSATVRKALHAVGSRGQRLRAVLMPPSTVRWAAHGLGSRSADLLDAGDRLLGSAGARLRRRSA